MFGNPEWFHNATKRIPIPKKTKGWMYYFGWSAAIVMPSLLLVASARIPESVIWAVIAGTLCFLDIRKLRQNSAERQAYENLHIIGEHTPEVVETEKYRLEIRN